MSFLNSINIIGSGLTAQQLRLDVVGENVRPPGWRTVRGLTAGRWWYLSL